MDETILVTGSRGFVGKRLVERLREKGYAIKEFDISLGSNILDKEKISEALEGVDSVIHLAAILDERADKLMEVNVKGTENLIEECSKKQIQKFVFLSSVGVYGSYKGVANEDAPAEPITLYERSKAKAEKIVLSYQEIMPVVIVRPAIAFGPNTYWEKIIRLIKKDFPVIGNGKNKFQTIYIKDLIDSIIFLMEEEDAIGEIFNVAEDKAHNLNEIVTIIRKELGMPAKPKHISETLGMLIAYLSLLASKIKGKKPIVIPSHIKRLVKNREYSIDKINALGWKPKYSFEEAVRETLQEINLK